MSHQLTDIATPHEHDVLSGRGNFVNYHAGNEYFRSLVRKHKLAYVACPKPQKGKFSRMIVDEIRARNPPGRFLKQDASTKLWYDIGDKKALDKTRQALREGAPEIMKVIDHDSVPAVPEEGATNGGGETNPDFVQDSSLEKKAFVGATQNSNSMYPMHPYMAEQMREQMRPPLPSQSGILPSASHTQIPQQQMAPNIIPQPRISQSAVPQQSLSSGLLPREPPHFHPAGNDRGIPKKLSPAAAFPDLEPRPIDPGLAVRMQQPISEMQSQRPPQNLDRFFDKQSSRNQPGYPPSHLFARASQTERVPIRDGQSQLDRTDSFRLDKIFSQQQDSFTNRSSKDKESGMGALDNSAMHMSQISTASFSIGDMTQETDISNVFDRSLQISDEPRKKENKASLLDMSMATIGDKVSVADPGNMSMATMDFSQSQANMSFSRVFEE